jgi:uncharacterized RDD family membrane protein YckC
VGPAAFILTALIGAAYYAFQEGSPSGQTLGKKVCGIKVVDISSGNSIGFGRALGRHFGSWISLIPCGLGYLWMLWDSDKQTWHDKMVSSNVVRV